MKNLFLILLMAFAVEAIGQSESYYNEFRLGEGNPGQDVDFSINLGPDYPKLRYDATETKWKLSHDGINFDEIAGKGFVEEAISNAETLESFDDLTSFPVEGKEGVIYLAKDTNYLYRWDGSAYVQVGGSVAPDATDADKGIIQLAGDLAGTAEAPTVPELANKAPIESPEFTGDPQAPTPDPEDNDNSVATTEFVTSAIQVANEDLVTGPESSNHNRAARFDGVSGKIIKDSNVSIDDSGNISTLGRVDSGNVRINGNSISTTSGQLLISTNLPADRISMGRPTRFTNSIFYNHVNDPSSGSDVVLSLPSAKNVRLTAEGDLVSISGIDMGDTGQEVTLMNQTGSIVIIKDRDASAGMGQIITGLEDDIELAPESSITLVYDIVYFRWFVIGGAGSGQLKTQSELGGLEKAKILEVPGHQLTTTGDKTRRIETGNTNLLVNPDFEHQSVSHGWFNAGSGLAIPIIEEDVSEDRPAHFGKKSIKFKCSGALGAGVCQFWQTVKTGGKFDYMHSIWAKSDTPYAAKVYRIIDENWTEYTVGKNIGTNFFENYQFPEESGVDYTGIGIEISVGEGEEVYVTADSARVGYQNNFMPTVLDQTISVEKPIQTEWQDYTPTVNTTTGAATNYSISAEWSRIGDKILIQGRVSFTGAPGTFTDFILTPPTGVEIDVQSTDRWVYNEYTTGMLKGGIYTLRTGVTTSGNMVVNRVHTPSGSNPVNVQLSGITSSDLQSGDYLTFKIFAKVKGWSATETTDYTIPMTQSGLVQEEDSEVVASGFAGVGSSAVTTVRFSSVKTTGSNVKYVGSATNGDMFVAETDGIYTASFELKSTDSATLTRTAIAIKDTDLGPSNLYVYDNVDYVNSAVADHRGAVSVTKYLKKGQGFAFVTQGGIALTSATAVITYQGTLKQVNVNPNQKAPIKTSEVRLEGASTKGSVANAVIKYDNLVKIKGDALVATTTSELGTFIEVKKDGLLNISGSLYYNASGNHFPRISRNQVNLTALPSKSETLNVSGSTSSNVASFSWSGEVQAGDIIRVISATLPTADASNNLVLHHQELEVAVSVTNVLPQFSDSDLVVKAAGNAGGTVTANTTNIPFTLTSTTHPNSWSGSTFIVPEDGVYVLEGMVAASVAAFLGIDLYVDGVKVRRISQANSETAAWRVSTSDKFTKGQIVSLRSTTTLNLNSSNPDLHYLTITKVGKPNVTGVDVTPFARIPYPKKTHSVAVSSISPSFSAESPAKVTFNSIIENQDGLFSGGTKVTAKESGVYDVSTAFAVGAAPITTSGGYTIVELYKNGSYYTPMIIEQNTIPAYTVRSRTIQSVRLERGDYLELMFKSPVAATPQWISLQVSQVNGTFHDTIFADVNDPAKIGEPYFSFNDEVPIGYIRADGTSIGKTGAYYNGEDYYPLYQRLWRLPGLTTSAGNPFIISAAKGASAKADWDAGKTIAIDLSNLFLRFAGTLSPNVGGYYADTFKSHQHQTNLVTGNAALHNVWGSGPNMTGQSGTSNNLPPALTSPTGGTETAPKHTSGYAYIRYKPENKMLKADFSDDLRYVYVKARNNSTQSIPHASSTNLTGWTEQKDTHDAFNPTSGTFVAPADGVYKISANVLFNSGAWASGSEATLQIKINGSSVEFQSSRFASAAGTYYNSTSASMEVELKAGDIVNIGIYQTSGSAKPLHIGAVNNWLTITRIPGAF